MIFIAATRTKSCLRGPGSTPLDRPLRSQWTGAARPEGRAANRGAIREVPAPELCEPGLMERPAPRARHASGPASGPSAVGMPPGPSDGGRAFSGLSNARAIRKH
eukprot:15480724-Alexandrium_andersonii.AAC.1